MAQPGHAAQPRDRRIVEDDAALRAIMCGITRRRHQPGPLEIDVEHGVPRLLGQFVGQPVGADAGVVEQNIDSPQLADRLLNGGRHRLVIAHVGGERQALRRRVAGTSSASVSRPSGVPRA